MMIFISILLIIIIVLLVIIVFKVDPRTKDTVDSNIENVKKLKTPFKIYLYKTITFIIICIGLGLGFLWLTVVTEIYNHLERGGLDRLFSHGDSVIILPFFVVSSLLLIFIINVVDKRLKRKIDIQEKDTNQID